jgi:hypothetical protein
MANEFYLQDLFEKTFGYLPADKFVVNKSEAVSDSNPFTVPTAANRTEYSSLGQPYYRKDYLEREMFMPVTLDGYLVPFAVVSITEKKTLIETPMPERGGSVTELISIDDYLVNIKGIIVEDEDKFPETQIKNIHELFLQNNSIELRSVITDIFLSGVFEHRVIIKEVKWPASPGVENAKPFEIDCKSDMIYELIIN